MVNCCVSFDRNWRPCFPVGRSGADRPRRFPCISPNLSSDKKDHSGLLGTQRLRGLRSMSVRIADLNLTQSVWAWSVEMINLLPSRPDQRVVVQRADDRIAKLIGSMQG